MFFKNNNNSKTGFPIDNIYIYSCFKQKFLIFVEEMYLDFKMFRHVYGTIFIISNASNI